jgi:hypothetical protein
VSGLIRKDMEAMEESRARVERMGRDFSSAREALEEARRELEAEAAALARELSEEAKEMDAEDAEEGEGGGVRAEAVAAVQRDAQAAGERAAALEAEAREAEHVASSLAQDAVKMEEHVRTLRESASSGKSSAVQAAEVAAWYRRARAVLEGVGGVTVVEMTRTKVVVRVDGLGPSGADVALLHVVTTPAPLEAASMDADLPTRVAALFGEPISASLALNGRPLDAALLPLDDLIDRAAAMPHDPLQKGTAARTLVTFVAAVLRALHALRI